MKNFKIGALATLTVLIIYGISPAFLNRLELLATDLRFQVMGPRTPGSEVAIAAIDEKSIDLLGRCLGREKSWPT